MTAGIPANSPADAPADRIVEFHSLTVHEVLPLTDDAVAVTLSLPDELAERFVHVPGQHVVVRAKIDGEDVRRTYSICSPPGTLRIGVKRIPGGVFSTYATTKLEPGDTLDVMTPIGEFTLDPATAAGARFVAVVAGSGVTPVLSMVAATLNQQADAHFTVIYGNRSSTSIMFIEELEALKDRFPERLQLFHILSREPHQIPLFQGRIDADKIQSLANTVIDVPSVDGWFLCGPLGMVETVQSTLGELGVADDRIHVELFYDQRIEAATDGGSAQDGTDPGLNGLGKAGSCTVRVTVDGRTSELRADADGPSLLDYARAVRAEIPFACKGGMCATCRAVVTAGEVVMTKNYALTPDELEAGFVLTCQAHPVTDTVDLNFDARG